MSIELRVEVGEAPPRDYAFDSHEVVIGGHPFNEVVIASPGTSARHGRFRLNGDGLPEYQDLQSLHGSRLRRGQEEPTPLPTGGACVLRLGDQILIGAHDGVRVTLTGFVSPQAASAPSPIYVPLPPPEALASALLAKLPASLRAEAVNVASGLLQRAQVKGACATLGRLVRQALALPGGEQADHAPALSLAFTLTLDGGDRAPHDWVLTCDEMAAREGLHAPLPHGHLRRLLRPGFLTLKPRLDRGAPTQGWAALYPLSLGVASQGDAFLRVVCGPRPQGPQLEALVALLAFLSPHLRLLVTDEISTRQRSHLAQENAYFRSKTRRRYAPRALASESPSMQAMEAALLALRDGSGPILMMGEAGSGKQLFARALHDLSPRAPRLFMAQRCAELDADALDVELFGEVNAAGEARYGLLEVLDGGTLFLDDIDRLPWALQGKLVRLLHERELWRVGDPMARTVDVRVVAACCQPLLTQVERGRFRRDLFAALSASALEVPPLRRRREDILPLARSFCHAFNSRYRLAVEALDSGAESRLISYAWPGNVRELRVVMETAVMKARRGLITVDHLDLRDVHSATRDDHTPT
jgi:hypothetical protein